MESVLSHINSGCGWGKGAFCTTLFTNCTIVLHATSKQTAQNVYDPGRWWWWWWWWWWLLYNTILCSRADSLCSCHMWSYTSDCSFSSCVFNIHRSGIHTVLFGYYISLRIMNTYIPQQIHASNEHFHRFQNNNDKKRPRWNKWKQLENADKNKMRKRDRGTVSVHIYKC